MLQAKVATELKKQLAKHLTQSAEIWRGTLTTSDAGAAEYGALSKIATVACLVVTKALPQRDAIAGATPAISTPYILMPVDADIRSHDELHIGTDKYNVQSIIKRPSDLLQKVSVIQL